MGLSIQHLHAGSCVGVYVKGGEPGGGHNVAGEDEDEVSERGLAKKVATMDENTNDAMVLEQGGKLSRREGGGGG